MPPFADWLTRVLSDGESVQEAPPALTPEERPAALAVLRTAFEDHALDVAGPPVPFEPQTGLGAAHLSADVALRFLPAVYRRARLRTSAEPLVAAVEAVLRKWPLSGVLADLDGGPTTPPEFGGPPGLQLLDAERLVGTGRAGWVPAAGRPAREWPERPDCRRPSTSRAPTRAVRCEIRR